MKPYGRILFNLNPHLPVPTNLRSQERIMGLFAYYSPWSLHFCDNIRPLVFRSLRSFANRWGQSRKKPQDLLLYQLINLYLSFWRSMVPAALSKSSTNRRTILRPMLCHGFVAHQLRNYSFFLCHSGVTRMLHKGTGDLDTEARSDAESNNTSMGFGGR